METEQLSIKGNASIFCRLALSCLVDADHTDTTVHYGGCEHETIVELLAEKRLEALNRYVKNLEQDTERSRQRTEVYRVCRDADMVGNIVSCDSPVGTGKTTAVMAHLLSQALKRGLRRIFVVLPFTNIIQQSVKTYRAALVLPGENQEYVVAELHHRADFEDEQSRQFTALWRAPIIVTTAVVFFETLASNKPATLRRLHALPGSAIFVDESHAALPVKLLPLAWYWIKGYANEWQCYWVMASGSLNRFWTLEEFDKDKPAIPEIMPADMRDNLKKLERNRITYRFHDTPFGLHEFIEWLASLPGPRIVILNTVQSAAVVALALKKRFGKSSVEHLSTALTPLDRDITIERIRSRLIKKDDFDWILVATSCVEAGMNFSFKTGVREAASLVSTLQLAGRVNRDDLLRSEAVWIITLKEEGLLRKHRGMNGSSAVLLDLMRSGQSISPDLCTEALKREIRLEAQFSWELLKMEKRGQFPQVDRNFKVIASDTRIVLIDKSIKEKIKQNIKVNWLDIQNGSVQIWGYRLDALRIPEIPGVKGLHEWNYDYDNFIGYMAGVLSVEGFLNGVCVVI